MLAALLGLFVATFIAATVVPFYSDPVFVALQWVAVAPLGVLVAVASLGNTLGAFINYGLGAGLERGGQRLSRFHPGEARLERARAIWQRWGRWSLLMSWAPVLGWSTVIAGAMRTPLWQFALLVGVAKTGRFLALAWLTAHAMGVDGSSPAP